MRQRRNTVRTRARVDTPAGLVTTNGDGRPDKWETYRPNTDTTPNEPPYVIASVAFDDSGSGTPQRRLVYDENQRSVRIEHPPARHRPQDNQ